MSTAAEPLSIVTRSGIEESRHRGSVVIVRGREMVYALGDPEQRIYCRSAVKPMQALPLLERGGVERFGLDPEELALMSASHNGTPAHTEVATRLLGRGGMTPEALLCGSHSPFDRAAGRAITAAGKKPEKIHNNCSGKHAGFLLLAQVLDVAPNRYLEPDGPVQTAVRTAVAEMAELPAAALGVGVDGCGAPTLEMPLVGLARAFANLTNPSRLAPVRGEACRRLLDAITAHPDLLAGEGRICTALIRALPGRIYCKNGAEGVYAFGLPGTGLGVAIKVEDGAERGYLPVVVDLLTHLGLWEQVPPAVRPFSPVPIRNTQRLDVGEVRSVVTWPASLGLSGSPS